MRLVCLLVSRNQTTKSSTHLRKHEVRHLVWNDVWNTAFTRLCALIDAQKYVREENIALILNKRRQDVDIAHGVASKTSLGVTHRHIFLG
jgi:hypothetical protein